MVFGRRSPRIARRFSAAVGAGLLLGMAPEAMAIAETNEASSAAFGASTPASCSKSLESLIPAQPEPLMRALPELVAGAATGLELEPAADRELLLKQARSFIAVRRAAAGSRELPEVPGCAGEGAAARSNPFCALSGSASRRARESRLAASRRERSARRARINELTVGILMGRLDVVRDASEQDLRSALRGFRDFESLRPLAQGLLTQPSCPPSNLAAALGGRAEEVLPDEANRSLARDLYKRSADCSLDGSAVRASYRLAMIYVWEGRCKEAEAYLAPIAERQDADDYRSRITFWRHYCAKQLGNEAVQASMGDRLKKEFPLSLHGLIAHSSQQSRDLTLAPHLVEQREPVARFRSWLRPGASSAARAAEALQSLGASDLSAEALRRGMEEAKEAEPAFQLYYAVLLDRSGDTVRKFNLLSSLFKDHPSVISRTSLQMLYPRNVLSALEQYQDRIDPYLVLSLMRQESAFKAAARSTVGAMGLMQLMPSTARMIERVSRARLLDPGTNIRIGIKYFSSLLDRFGGDIELALAGYNAGPEKVEEWLRRYPTQNRLLFLDLIPFKETRDYVVSIARNYYWYLRLYSHESLQSKIERQPATVKASAGHEFRTFALLGT